MDFLRGLFGLAPRWDDEPPHEQLRAFESNPVVRMGLVRLGPDCDVIPSASGPFGTALTNPVPVNGPTGEIVYLNRLRSPSGVGFFYHRPGTESAPNYPHPVDVYELLAVDGSTHLHLFFAGYHPRRSLRVPDGLFLTRWRDMDAMHRLMVRVPGFGINQPVAAFPWGLPAAIAGNPSLREISPGLGTSLARRVQATLEDLERSGQLPSRFRRR